METISNALYNVSGQQGWDDNSRIIMLDGFLEELVASGKTTVQEFRDYLETCAREENEAIEQMDYLP